MENDKDGKDSSIDELNNKLVVVKKELNDLKINYTMKCKEVEQLQKDNQELRDSLRDKSNYNSKDNQEVKKLMEEIQRLRSLNKNRDEILAEMENKNKSLRDTET